MFPLIQGLIEPDCVDPVTHPHGFFGIGNFKDIQVIRVCQWGSNTFRNRILVIDDFRTETGGFAVGIGYAVVLK